MSQFTINLKDQTAEVETYQWTADDKFFQEVQGPEIQQGKVDVSLSVHRTVGAYELCFRFKGDLTLPCDRCLEPMQQPVEGESMLKVKLGEALEDDGDLITIPEEDGTLSLDWNIYEMIALLIPLRHVHADGECKGEIGSALGKYMPSDEEQEAEKPSDPRWDALKEILDNN